MRTSLTAVIEQANAYTTDFSTEPYETAWALEARWFVNVLEIAEGSTVSLSPQISPDGLTWCEEGLAPLVFAATGLQSLPLTNFGGWLRLQATFTGDHPSAKFLIYLALKG